MLKNQNKGKFSEEKELLSVHATLNDLKTIINKDLQMRFALKHFGKKYEDEEMNRDVVLSFQITLYMIGEYDENIDYSNEPVLEKSFAEIKDFVIPQAKEIIDQNKETRELIFRFNYITNYLFHKIFCDNEDVLSNPIIKNREKILNEHFTNPNEYREPESSRKYFSYYSKFVKDVKEFEKVFKKAF